MITLRVTGLMILCIWIIDYLYIALSSNHTSNISIEKFPSSVVERILITKTSKKRSNSTNIKKQPTNPCKFSLYSDNIIPSKYRLNLCIINNSHAASLLSSDCSVYRDINQCNNNNDNNSDSVQLPFQLTIINKLKDNYKQNEVSSCDTIINLIDSQPWINGPNHCNHKYICPESCYPKPYLQIPINWIMNDEIWTSSISSSFALSLTSTLILTCSITVGDVYNLVHKQFDFHINTTKPLYILYLLSERRIMECYEHDTWMKTINPIRLSIISELSRIKRSSYGMIIWIGSKTRLNMSISQIEILKTQYRNPYPSEYITGWIATEEQYPCDSHSIRCSYHNNDYELHSNISNLLKPNEINHESFGWSCGQRRPLRALSHVLSLYSTMFIFLVDDDTYVNISYFNTSTSLLTKYINTVLYNQSITLSFLEMKHRVSGGKISKRGIMYGGRGYLFGYRVIKQLQSNIIHGPSLIEDLTRDPNQMRYLSVYNHLLYLNELAINENQSLSCIDSNVNDKKLWNSYNDSIKLSSEYRLIDICRNLYSNEYSCYHSDHAMTHCFVHGVYHNMIHIGCNGTYLTLSDSNRDDNIFLRTCGYGASVSDHLLSCHRMIYNRSDLSGKLRSYQISKSINYNSQRQLSHEWCDSSHL